MARTKVNGETMEGSEKDTNSAQILEKVFITCDNTYEDVIRYNSQGTKVYFDDSPGKLLSLTEEQIKELPRDLKIKYDQAVVNHERLSKEDPAWTEIQKRLKIQQVDYASPMAKIEGNKTKPGLVTRNARVDKVDYWRSKGYEVATPEHLVNPTMRQVEGHFEISKLGATESVLMVTTAENKQALLDEIAAKRKAAGERLDEANKRAIHDAGFKTE